MGLFQPTNKNNPCPVCTDTKGNCRHVDEGRLTLCMTMTDKSTAVPGWKFKGLDKKQKLWGVWVPASNSGDRRQWQARLDQEKRQRALQEAKSLSQAMSTIERDRWYRKLLAELPLHQSDRADLIGRGFTDEQIAAIGFKSVNKWQRLSQQYPSNLPGVSPDGNRLVSAVEGYLCPIANADGLIVGMQLRRRAGNGNKYRWLSSKQAPANLRESGELPLPVIHFGDSPITYLVEGTGPKPNLAAELLNGTVIGAAGGLWASSPNQLTDLLSKSKTNTVVLVPDAGDVGNKHVVRRDRVLIQTLRQLGYEPQVLWWGQILKGDPDIDENPNTAKLISADEFLEICDWECRIKPARDSQAQLNALTFSPTHEYHEEFLPDLSLPKGGGFLFVDSPMGSGKTHQTKRLIKQYRSRMSAQSAVRFFGYRNSLLRQTANKINEAIPGLACDLIHDLEAFNRSSTDTLINTSEAVLLCVDSLLRIDPQSLTGALIFLDEVDAVLKHLILGNTCSKNRERIMVRLGEIINHVLSTGGWVVAMEASLTDLTIGTLRGLAPDAAMQLVVNKGQRQTWQVTVGEGETSGLIAKIIDNYRSGLKQVIPTDSQEFAEHLHRLLEEIAPSAEVLRADGKTSERAEIRQFLTDPNTYIQDQQPDVLIYTPTAESGLDVTIDYFDLMVFYMSNLETRAQMQLMGRVRQPIPRYGLVGKASFADQEARSLRPEILEKDLLKNTARALYLTKLAIALAEQDPDGNWLERVNELANPAAGSPARTWLEAWCNYKARENGARADMRQNLIRALKANGHQVEDTSFSRDQLVVELRSQVRKIIEEVEAQKLEDENADIPLDIAYKILRSSNSTEKKRRQARKALLQDRLPGVDLTKDFLLHAVVNERGQFLKRTTLLWYAQNLDKAKALDRKRFANHIASPFVFLPDFKSNTLRAELIHRSGVLELIDSGGEWGEKNSAPELCQFLKWCQWNRFEIKRVLGLTIGQKTTAMQAFSKFARKLGYDLKSRKVGPKGSQSRLWSIVNLEDGDRLKILQALDCKHVDCESAQLVSTTQYINNKHPGVTTVERVAKRVFKEGQKVVYKGSPAVIEMLGTATAFVKTEGGLEWMANLSELREEAAA